MLLIWRLSSLIEILVDSWQNERYIIHISPCISLSSNNFYNTNFESFLIFCSCCLAGKRPIWQWGIPSGTSIARWIFAGRCACLNTGHTDLYVHGQWCTRCIPSRKSLYRRPIAGFQCPFGVHFKMGTEWIFGGRVRFPLAGISVGHGYVAHEIVNGSIAGGCAHQELCSGHAMEGAGGVEHIGNIDNSFVQRVRVSLCRVVVDNSMFLWIYSRITNSDINSLFSSITAALRIIPAQRHRRLAKIGLAIIAHSSTEPNWVAAKCADYQGKQKDLLLFIWMNVWIMR